MRLGSRRIRMRRLCMLTWERGYRGDRKVSCMQCLRSVYRSVHCLECSYCVAFTKGASACWCALRSYL